MIELVVDGNSPGTTACIIEKNIANTKKGIRLAAKQKCCQ
jgi:hypothetical protein